MKITKGLNRKRRHLLGLRPWVAIVLGVVVLVVASGGIMAYGLLSQTRHVDIGIVANVTVEPGSLDNITIPTEVPDTTQAPDATPSIGAPDVTFPAVTVSPYTHTLPWLQGHSSVYVVASIPIQRVAQKDPLVENILCFGVDSRSSSYVTSRTDMLIIVTIDKRSNSVKLTSIMRDTQVTIPGRSKPDKINAAYVYGGVGLLVNTLNQNFDLDIQKFVMVDMLSAEQVVDAAGGVTINVTADEIPYLNAGVESTNKMFAVFSSPSALLTNAGSQTLNGRQTVAYGRIRKLDTEYQRTARQRKVMEALLSKFWKADLARKYSVLQKSLSSIETNIDSSNLISIAVGTVSLLKSVESYRVPQSGMFTTDYSNWNLVVDETKQVPALHNFIWGVG